MSFSELRFFLSVLEMPTVVLHVAAGFVALVMAPIAMWTQKGGKQHRRWGKVYFWAMFVIFVTALALVYFRPNFFLLMISFLSFYCAFSGYRALFRKRPGQATWLDWLGAGSPWPLASHLSPGDCSASLASLIWASPTCSVSSALASASSSPATA